MALSPSVSRSGHVPVADGLHLWYELRGNGPEVLVVPSASWLARDLDPLIEGRTVLFYDVRGRGRSAAIRDDALLGVHKDVTDLERLRVALGLERFDLLGWSYHGAIAARYTLAHRERVRRVVLVGPTAPCRDPYFDDFLGRFASKVDLDGLQALDDQRRAGLKERDPLAWCRAVHRLYFLAYVADPKSLERMQSSPCVLPNLDPDHVNNQGRRAIEVLGAYDWRAEFRGLDTPILILHGAQDPVPVEGSQEWVRVLSNARLVVWDDVSHMPWLEAPERFFDTLEAFLTDESVTAGRAGGNS